MERRTIMPAKGKGQKPDAPQDGEDGGGPAIVTDHGYCKDCGEHVDVVVEAWQVVGDGTFRCVECRIKRIKEDADTKIAALKQKAAKIREDARQQPLL
jgi:hypothetical protein